MQQTIGHAVPNKVAVASAITPPAYGSLVVGGIRRSINPPAPSLVCVWQGTLETFVANATGLLSVGMIGFAAVPLISPMLAIIALPLTRAALVHIIVYKRFSTGWLRRLPGLLITAWLYTAIITASQIGIGVPLSAWGFNLNLVDQKSKSGEDTAKQVLLHSMDAMSLTCDSPLKHWLPSWRNRIFDELLRKPYDAYEQQLLVDYQHSGIDILSAGVSGIEAQAKAHQRYRAEFWWMFGGGLVALFTAETLFVFRIVPGVAPARLLWLSLRHFGTVAGHLWLLRLIVVGLKVIFVFVPIVVVDRYAYLARDWGWFGSAIQGYALAICLALINAIVSTFEAVYAARLYLALTE